MSDTMLERHYRDRVQSVHRLVSLPEPERATLTWHDYQDLLALCVDLSASLRDLIDKEFRRVFKHPDVTVAWLKERRVAIEELSDGYVQLAHAVRDGATLARQAN